MNLKRLLHPLNFDKLPDIPPDILHEENVPPSSQFSRHSLMFLDGFGWMSNCRFYLVTKPGVVLPEDIRLETQEVDSLNSLLSIIRNKAKRIGKDVVPSLEGSNKILISLDTETTGLDTSVKIIGGKAERNIDLAAVTLAVSSSVGYYIPIRNTEEDGVPNWPESEVVEFLKTLMSDEFHAVFFNFKYDGSVFLLHGVPLNTNSTDMYVMSKLSGDYEFYPYLTKKTSLKAVSLSLLGRRMLELSQLLGKKTTKDEDSNVIFTCLPAVNSVAYATSDAVNTYALFERCIINDVDGRNPYKHQPTSAQITSRCVYPALSMLISGLPIAFNHAFSMLRTVLRRIIILERQMGELFGEDILFTSNEQVSDRIVRIIKRNWSKSEDKFLDFLQDNVGIAHTKREFKKVGLKITYKFGSDVADLLLKSLDKHTFISVSDRDLLREICGRLVLYRSLQHEKLYYLGLLRAIKKDDRNYSFVNINLKVEGTDTGRFSNDRLKGVSRIYFKDGRPLYFAGDGVPTGVNAQGFSHDRYDPKPAKRIKNMFDVEAINSIDLEVEKRLKDEMSEV